MLAATCTETISARLSSTCRAASSGSPWVHPIDMITHARIGNSQISMRMSRTGLVPMPSSAYPKIVIGTSAIWTYHM